MNGITIIFGSATYAAKAQRLLIRGDIPSELIKIDNFKAGEGCAHGIRVGHRHIFAAIGILRERGMEYSIEGGK